MAAPVVDMKCDFCDKEWRGENYAWNGQRIRFCPECEQLKKDRVAATADDSRRVLCYMCNKHYQPKYEIRRDSPIWERLCGRAVCSELCKMRERLEHLEKL